MNSYRRDKEKKEGRIFTKETFGMVLVLFATLILVCLITRDLIFSDPGREINAFLFGVFGWGAFFLDVLLITWGVRLVTDKRAPKKSTGGKLLRLALFFAFMLVHTITTSKVTVSGYGAHLKGVYAMGEKGFGFASACGMLASIINYLPVKVIGLAGTYAVYGVIIAGLIYFAIRSFISDGSVVEEKETRGGLVTPESEIEKKIKGVKSYPIDDVIEESDGERARLFYRADDFELKSKKEKQDAERREESFKILYPNYAKGNSQIGLGYGQTVGQNQTYSNMYGEDIKKKIDYIKTPTEIKINGESNDWKSQRIQGAVRTDIQSEPTGGLPPMYTHEEVDYSSMTDTEKRMVDYSRYTEIEDVTPSTVTRENSIIEREPSIEEPEEYIEESNIPPVTRRFFEEESEPEEPITRRNFGEEEPFTRRGFMKEGEREEETPTRRPIISEPEVEKGIEQPVLPRRRQIIDATPVAKTEVEQNESDTYEQEIPINRVYNKPPIDLFKVYKQDINAPKENHEERVVVIEKTLAEFGIDAKVENFVQGPTVTRYEILMPAGVSVKKVPNHAEDIAMRLEATSVRIEAPIPGKNLVGIEVPNKVKEMVGIRDIIESEEFNKRKQGDLTFAIGKDIVGKCICDNLAKGPHFLVAGSTGMGKSVCLNSMLISMITKYSPEELRLVLIDPKQVEFTMYNHLPHLMIDEIITNIPKALATMKWAVDEMERRYTVFGKMEVRDIDEYNEFIASETVAKMPKIVIVIDEVADLMQQGKKDLEDKILRLSAKARSAGIHLVLATQRPSVDVITGVIKANLPSRIAFRVSNSVDSITILNESGAEKLLGNGDMLYRTVSMAGNARYQGAFISTAEVKAIVAYIKENNVSYFDNKAADEINKALNPPKPDDAMEERDGDAPSKDSELFVDALRLVVKTGSASISMIQRRFSVGYAKAGSLIDKMDSLGYISPFDGSKARQVLITKEEFEEKYGEL